MGFIPFDKNDSYQSDEQRRHRHLVRWIIAVSVVLLCLIPITAVFHHTDIARRARVEYGKRLKSTIRATPSLMEWADGYHPVGEVQVANKRGNDHVVRIVKPGSVDKYVYWTTGPSQTTTLTLPGVRIPSESAGTISGPSARIRIILRRRPSVVQGTPYIDGHDVINATNAGLIGNGIADNTMRLNTIMALLPTSVHKTIALPAGHFAFTGVIRMASNLTIMGTHSKTFIQQPPHAVGQLVIWYPAGRARGYDGMHDVTWRNVNFQSKYADLMPTQPIFQSLIHARNITFDGCTFNMIQGHLSHLLDVDGSTNVTVRNSTVIGSADRGQTFKEAFQMDVAALGASGYNDKDTVLNNLPTTHTIIEHNRFLPLRDKHGRLLLPAPAPFGTHMAYAPTTSDKSYIHDGVFADNYVEDPVSFKGAGTENSAVIHFDAADDIIIDHNTFVWTGETSQPSWAVAFYARSHRMVKPSGWHGITITNNVFRRFAPDRGAFVLYRESGSVNVPGKSVSDVVVSGNRFEGMPVRIALRWLHHYSTMFISTYDQRIVGSDDVADGAIHLDGTAASPVHRS